MTPPPLLLAGHGSADPAGAEAFGALCERVASVLALQSVDVAGGFIELSEPPLSAAVDLLAAGGHRRVVAVPVVLSAAGHAKGDIPAALAVQRDRHPGMSFAYGRPLGPHPALLSLLADRIDEALGRGHHRTPAGAAGDGTHDPLAVLVVGRGSTDPDANAEMYKTTRLVWETHQAGRWRVALAETAFVSLARPDVAEGPGSLPQARDAANRGGPLLPVSWRAAGPRRDPGKRLRPGRGANWTCAALTSSATATRSPS